jgi:tetratricopeptide (TPR) repeat protein
MGMKSICTAGIFFLSATGLFAQNNMDAWFQEAFQRYENKQFREASAGFSKVIQADSLFLEAFVFRGLSQQAMKNHKNALADFQSAIDIAPKDTMLYLMKADLEAEIGANLQAIVDYSSAIVLDPSNAEIYRSRASQYYLLNHYVLALEDFRKAIGLDPSDATDFFSAGICLNILEDYEQAISFFSTAAISNPRRR